MSCGVMKKQVEYDANAVRTPGGQAIPYKVRLPGFMSDGDVGLGDVVKRITYAAGIKPCGGCEKRAASLNRLLKFGR